MRTSPNTKGLKKEWKGLSICEVAPINMTKTKEGKDSSISISMSFHAGNGVPYHGNMQIMNKEYSNLEDLVYLVINQSPQLPLLYNLVGPGLFLSRKSTA